MNRIESKWYWGTSVFLTTEDGCGIVECTFDDDRPHNCDIFNLNVHPTRRQQGYATRLMQAAEREAKDRGCIYAYLWAEKDSWTEKWYERLGYEQVNEHWRKPPHETVIWMIKEL